MLGPCNCFPFLFDFDFISSNYLSVHVYGFQRIFPSQYKTDFFITYQLKDLEKELNEKENNIRQLTLKKQEVTLQLTQLQEENCEFEYVHVGLFPNDRNDFPCKQLELYNSVTLFCGLSQHLFRKL